MSAVLAPPEALPRDEVTSRADFQRVMGASDAVMADLDAFLVLVAEWNEKMNLIGPATLPVFWSRHAWDSAQLLLHAPQAKTWADLGAGAGFPGIVLAILLKKTPGAHVHLVESMTKRCRFLAEVLSVLDLPATIHNSRAEDLNITVDIVTARACAPAVRLLGYARPYLRRGALGLFLKGQDVESELTEATKCWKFQSSLRPSLSSPASHVLVIEGTPRER